MDSIDTVENYSVRKLLSKLVLTDGDRVVHPIRIFSGSLIFDIALCNITFNLFATLGLCSHSSSQTLTCSFGKE